jgi:hypothetical protein
MKNLQAIVTLVIGEKYLKRWKKLCQENWQNYADKHGYDLIVIDTSLDRSERALKRSPAWQKCLILSQEFSQQYERIVWIDSDILINSAIAPCIVKDVPIDKVGATDEYSWPTPQLYDQILERKYDYYEYARFNPVNDYKAKLFYSNYGLPPKFDRIVQTGVMVLSPHHHRQILEKVYFEYEDKGQAQWNYEMRPLSWELLEADYVHWIDPRFNVIWFDYLCLYYPFLLEKPRPISILKLQRKLRQFSSNIGILPHLKLKKVCANTAFMNSFFLHFSGPGGGEMPLINTKATSWRDVFT